MIVLYMELVSGSFVNEVCYFSRKLNCLLILLIVLTKRPTYFNLRKASSVRSSGIWNYVLIFI